MLLFGVKLLLNILVSCRGQKISPNCDPSPSRWEVFPAKSFFSACRSCQARKKKGKNGQREIGAWFAVEAEKALAWLRSAWPEPSRCLFCSRSGNRLEEKGEPRFSRHLAGETTEHYRLFPGIWEVRTIIPFRWKNWKIGWFRWFEKNSDVLCDCLVWKAVRSVEEDDQLQEALSRVSAVLHHASPR